MAKTRTLAVSRACTSLRSASGASSFSPPLPDRVDRIEAQTRLVPCAHTPNVLQDGISEIEDRTGDEFRTSYLCSAGEWGKEGEGDLPAAGWCSICLCWGVTTGTDICATRPSHPGGHGKFSRRRCPLRMSPRNGSGLELSCELRHLYVPQRSPSPNTLPLDHSAKFIRG